MKDFYFAMTGQNNEELNNNIDSEVKKEFDNNYNYFNSIIYLKTLKKLFILFYINLK